jgi:hypothetical protein
MREGVVVMLDALGYKGIWKPDSGETEEARETLIISKMKRLRQAARQFRTNPRERTAFDIECECISDTIVLGVWVKEDRATNWLALAAAVSTTSALCSTSAMLPPAFAYRGAVAFGRFLIEDGFVLGPAIDDAAENMEQAEGAFIWLTDSALPLARYFDIETVAPAYSVPLKNGRTVQTFAIVPWVDQDIESQARTAQGLLNRFNRPDPSVQLKRENTAHFYNHALMQWHAALSIPREPWELRRPKPPPTVPVVK